MPFVGGYGGGSGGGGTTITPHAPGLPGGNYTPPAQPQSPTGSSPLQGYVNFAQGMYNQAQDQASQYGSLMNSQIGFQNAGYQNDSGYLNANYQNQLAQLGLTQQGNAIDQAANSRQMGYYNDLFNLDSGDYTRNVGYQNALKGFLGAGYNVTTGQHQNVLQQLADQASQARNQAGRQYDDALSAATAAGANTSRGHQQANTNIASDLAYNLEANRTSKRGENLNYLQATVNRDQQSAGIDNQIASLTSDFDRTKLTHGEQLARLQDRSKQLDLTAQSYGLNGQQLSTQLQHGLTSLNLNNQISVGQLMEQIANGNSQASQMVSLIMQLGPQLLQ